MPRGDAGAQDVREAPAGVRVRLEVADSLRPGSFSARRQQIIGNLVRQTPDSLYLRMRGAEPFAIERAVVHRIDISEGATRARSAAVQGLGLGAVAAAFTFLGNLSSDDRGKRTLSAGAIGLGLGAVLGAISPFETWDRVRQPVVLGRP